MMTYYTLLQVAPTATEKEIRKAYRALAKKYHPDRLQQASPEVRLKGEEKLKQINLAYAILCHPVKRRQYDATLRSQNWVHSTHSTSQARRGGQQTQASRQQPRQATQTEARQRLAQIRSQYLRYRAELTAVEQHLMAWYLAYGKAVGVVGVITSLCTAVSGTLLLWLMQRAGLTAGLGTTMLGTIFVYVIQVCAILMVVERISLPPKPTLELQNVSRIGGTVLISLYTLNGFSNLVFVVTPISFLHLFGVTFLGHLLSCAILSQQWIKPILAERQKWETKIASAEEVMDYWRESLSYF